MNVTHLDTGIGRLLPAVQSSERLK